MFKKETYMEQSARSQMFLWISVDKSCQKLRFGSQGADSLREVEQYRSPPKACHEQFIAGAIWKSIFAPLGNGCGTKGGISGAACARAKRLTQNGRSQARSELRIGSATHAVMAAS
jgi:hypothetical protein